MGAQLGKVAPRPDPQASATTATPKPRRPPAGANPIQRRMATVAAAVEASRPAGVEAIKDIELPDILRVISAGDPDSAAWLG